MNWYDYREFKYFEKIEELRDIVLLEYAENKDKLDQTKNGALVREIYNVDSDRTDVYWFGFPIIEVDNINERYAKFWPKTSAFVKDIPGVINTVINFVGPKSVVPRHSDTDIEKEIIGDREAIGVIIGINMPSTDPDIVGFEVNKEIKSWGSGEIVAINGYKRHSGWNESDQWRVSMLIDLDKKYWSYD